MSNPPDDISWGRFDDVQHEITRWADKQFPGRTPHQTIFKLMVHEIPELAIHLKEKGTEGIGTELADAFILLLDLASMWDVNVMEAIRAKMEINYGRIWERDAHGIMQHVKGKTPSVTSEPGPYGCPNCPSGTPSRMLTPEERTEVVVQWGNQSVCPFDSLCLNCKQLFASDCPF